MQEVTVKTGDILIAEPFMMDPNFRRSVVFLCDHTIDEGTVGFILNKPIKMNITDLVDGFPEFESEVYYGGPVSTDTIHYIHDVGEVLDESTEVINGVFWGGDFEKLKFLIKSELIKPNNIKFFVGYSGWSANQLEDELAYGSWVQDKMYPNYAFKEKSRTLWSKVLNNKGDTYSVISQMPDNLHLN